MSYTPPSQTAPFYARLCPQAMTEDRGPRHRDRSPCASYLCPNPIHVASAHRDLSTMKMEFDDEGWRSYAPEPSFPTNVIPPTSKQLEGFDAILVAQHLRKLKGWVRQPWRAKMCDCHCGGNW